MSENKFIKHLRGEQTAKSVLEIKNQRTTTSFANMPEGTSNANEVYSDHRGNATAVLKGTDNWKLNGSSLIVPTDIYGDGRDVTGTYDVAGQTLWINASYTFPQAKIFTPNTKWVLKLCGNRLLSGTNDTIPLTLLIKFGTTTIATKAFTIKEHAFNFAEELVVDFAESNTNNIKVAANSAMTVQVLCGDATATAQIYNGMTVFTALQRRVDADVVASDEKTFDEVVQDIIDISEELDNVADDLADHIANKTNPHEVTKSQVGLGNCDNTSDLDKPVSTATQNALDGKVDKSGDTMTGALSILRTASSNTPLITIRNGTASSRRWNFLPSYNATSLSVYSGTSETGGYRFTLNGFVPASNNVRDLGSSSLKWKAVYAGALNNGANLVIPTKGGTLATMADVDLAASSGRMITEQGVWYAKMYAATVAPSAADGTNYADFSQTDGKGNPIIVTYNRVNGAWVRDKTITPPAEYDGYVIVTSKIWDIAEQTGQQGGRILWNHTSKEFTPYPQIISFENINVTGNSTVIMPQNPGANQIVNKDYVDEAIASIPTPTIDVAQSIDAEIVGTLTVTDGSVVSGFSSSNYLSLPGLFEFNNLPFEICGAFTTPSTLQDTPILGGKNPKRYGNVGVSINIIYNKIRVYIIGDVDTQIIDSVTSLSDSTKYYIKIQYDGTDYKILLSTDGSNYNLETSVTATELPMAAFYRAGYNSTIASVDMSGWSVKCDGITIWQGMDTPGLHQRAAKGHEVIAFQAPTVTNNYTWYRKYADGWVEQGGNSTTETETRFYFPIQMADTNYTALSVGGGHTGSGADIAVYVWARDTTYIEFSRDRSTYLQWEVKGMAA
jgi:hypothetical protein